MKFFVTAEAVKSSFRLGYATRIICLGLFLATLGLLAACNSEDSITFPKPPDIEPMHWLYDIEGTSATDIWACGNMGTMLHFDPSAPPEGNQWPAVDMGTTSPIVRMYKDSDGTLYACGHNGHIWRNTGGSWIAMDSGTNADLFGLGSYLGNMHVCGDQGALRRLAGSTWESTGRNVMILRDEQGAPQDTLLQNEDIASLLTINQYAIGGAYFDPAYEGEHFGILGTRPMILAEDNEFDWALRALSGDPLIKEEWVLSSLSDPEVPSNNYLGTSEGWVFRLNDDFSWNLMRPKVTNDPSGGVRDMWMDSEKNVYMATDEGQLVFQTWDYDFVTGTGSRTTLMDLPIAFSTVWGSSPENLYLAGFFENKIIHASHNQDTGDFTWEEIPVTFPSKASANESSRHGPLGLLGR